MRMLSPGAVLRFHHIDAFENPKPNRPGIVNETRAGRYLLYYGSTFKRGGAPRDAVVADPAAPPTTSTREFADLIMPAINDRTCFHGSMLSEADASSQENRIYPSARCPNDILDTLEEQAEDWLLAFSEVWQRTGWLPVSVRAGLLYALWWRAKLEDRDRLALTLLVCDGWKLPEISALRKRDVQSQVWTGCEGSPRRLLPRTARMIELWDAAPDSTLGYDDIASDLEPMWTQLLLQVDRNVRRVCPAWNRVTEKA